MAERQEEKKMQLDSAPGNKSVESRKGGAQQQAPVLSSVNEELPPIQKIMSNEEMSNSRTDLQQAKQDYLASVGKKIIEDNNRRLAGDNTAEAKPITAPKSYNEQMDYSEFDEAKGREKLKENETFKDIVAKADAKNKEYEDKAKKASRYAKIAAWGNLFTNLAKLAGGGKQTYVKHDAKYLTDALAKSDKAREMYDAVREQNENKVKKYEQDYMKNLEKIHYSLQAQENKDKADRNEMNQKMIQNSLKNARNSEWLNYQIQNMLEKGERNRDKFEYTKLKDRLNRIAQSDEKEKDRELRKLLEEMKIKAKKDSKDNKGDKGNKGGTVKKSEKGNNSTQNKEYKYDL